MKHPFIAKKNLLQFVQNQPMHVKGTTKDFLSPYFVKITHLSFNPKLNKLDKQSSFDHKLDKQSSFICP